MLWLWQSGFFLLTENREHRYVDWANAYTLKDVSLLDSDVTRRLVLFAKLQLPKNDYSSADYLF
jgi:hypothetical protein